MKGRIRRGLLKSYVLKLLQQGELSGYDIMQTIQQETGFWKPSAGSMYPLLQSLTEAELIQYRMDERRKVYSLTPKGQQAAEEVAAVGTEVQESIDRSIAVFNNVFGPEEKDHWRHHRVPEPLRERWQQLHRAWGDAALNPSQLDQAADLLDQLLQLLQRPGNARQHTEEE